MEGVVMRFTLSRSITRVLRLGYSNVVVLVHINRGCVRSREAVVDAAGREGGFRLEGEPHAVMP